MNDKPVAILQELIQHYGIDLAWDSRRTEALLNDYCPTYRREVFVLVNAQREQVPRDLSTTPSWMPTDAAAERLSSRLQERLGLSGEAADWAVRSWSLALGIERNPSKMSRWLDMARAMLANRGVEKSPAPNSHESSLDDVESTQAAAVTSHGAQNSTMAAENPSTSRAGSGNGNATVDASREGSPIRLGTYAAIVSVVAVLAVGWVLATWTPTWGVAASWLAELRTPVKAVQDEYPLPRYAWVSDGPLMVRTGPDMAEASISMLPAGETVRVVGYSSDLQWSQIVEPLEGWVSNWYLNFLAEDEPELAVRLIHQPMTPAADGVRVYGSPSTAGDPISTLQSGDTVITMAITADGRWRQVVQPVIGWVTSDSLAAQ